MGKPSSDQRILEIQANRARILRDYLGLHGISRKAFAAHAGISPTMISRLLSLKSDVPYYKWVGLLKMAEEYCIPESKRFCDEEWRQILARQAAAK